MARLITEQGEEIAPLITEAGLELTDEDIAALAAEAEAGYDLSLAEEVPIGRPPLEEGTAPRISVRLPQSVYRAARDRAQAQGRTVSTLVREAVIQYLAR